jgi:diguanylate cyclase (GGDEF)-like protein
VFLQSKIVRILYRLTMPGSLLLATVLVLLRLGVVSDSDAHILTLLPAGVFLCGLILSMAFRRSRLFFALLALSLSQTALAFVVPRLSDRNGLIVTNAIAILLPLDLLVLAFLKERGIVSPAGRRRLAIVAVQVLAVTSLCVPAFEPAAAWLDKAFVPEGLSAWSHLSQAALLAFALALLVIMVPLIRRYRAVESSLLWTLVASFLALRVGSATPQAGLFFAAGGMALIVALLETSYRMAYHDELTQLPSRRALNEALMKLPSVYTIAMIDVDHFKKFNDNYGHEAGDQALRLVASRLAHIAGGGRAYRYGGEEFAIVFPGKAASEVVLYLDRMRKVIEQSTFVVRERERRGKRRVAKRSVRKETHVTVSIGVATSNGERVAPSEVMRIADKALYRAKARGRNCTVNAKGSPSAVPAMSMAEGF